MSVSKPTVETDPFLDTDFAPLDTRNHGDHIAALGRIAEEHPELQQGLVQEPVTPQPVTPASIPEDQPETFEVDGGTVTLSHDAKGWHGVLTLDEGGGDEVFHGKTQKELITKVLAGKVKATAQIRKLNKKIKLGTPVEDVVTVSEPVLAKPNQLNANDIFEIKTALEADPDKAFDLRFIKKYGMSESDFVALVQQLKISAKRGEEAYEELTVEGVSKEFLEAHKDEYYPYAENGEAIMTWLCRNKLRRNVTKSDSFGTISGELLRKGLYTVENLEEAFEDLRDSELLIPPPQLEVPEEVEEIEQEPIPVAAVLQPAQAVQPVAQNPRIVASKRQARGGLGIRPSAVQTRQVDDQRAPSADELENLPTDQLRELLNNTYRYARSARR
jgi:hypothetical protein